MFTANILAQTGSEEKKQKSIFEIRNEGGNKYLKMLMELKDFEADDRRQQAMKSAAIIPIASFMAPNAYYDSLMAVSRYRFRADSIGQMIRKHGQAGIESLEQMLRQEIPGRSLVMFNETHTLPEHRMLVERLLPLFAENGFTYLALEALSEGQDHLLNGGNPPTINTGFYTQDPHFANLIRSAQDLGFQFVAYENRDRSRDREEGQASNLYEATFGKDSEAKVLVLAGVDHILEKPTPRGKRWLGAILNEEYELNPLTLNQHHLRYFSKNTDGVAWVKASTFDNHLLESVDYHVINNLPLTSGEPNFTFDNTYDQPVQLSFYLNSEVRIEEDYDRLIPVQSALAEKGQSLKLSIPDRELELIIYDQHGQELQRQTIKN
ncbi:MAG: hypothetical protein R3222_06370 [Balneolaceae bacterium]|nr:hypothetical protein [Balneolaceae bacterium]